MRHDLARLLLTARTLGYEAEATRNGHVRFRHASGAVVIAASTPSCPRSWLNTRADLRRSLRERGVTVEVRPLPPKRAGKGDARKAAAKPPTVTLAARLRRLAAEAECLGPAGCDLAKELRRLARAADARRDTEHCEER